MLSKVNILTRVQTAYLFSGKVYQLLHQINARQGKQRSQTAEGKANSYTFIGKDLDTSWHTHARTKQPTLLWLA